MREGDVVLTPIPQADGMIKNRPAVLAVLPRRSVAGSIGKISSERRKRLLQRLSDHLLKAE